MIPVSGYRRLLSRLLSYRSRSAASSLQAPWRFSIRPLHRPSPMRTFLELLLVEPALAAVALFVLRANGHFSAYGLTPSWKGAAEGLALAIVAYAVWILTDLAVYPFFPAAFQSRGDEMVAPDLMFGLVIAISIVNPLFEEFFVSGYLITTLKHWKDPWFAINVSVTVRLLYHLHQGPSGLVTIIPLGVVFAQWYVRTGRLWPLVIAHALFDFAALNRLD